MALCIPVGNFATFVEPISILFFVVQIPKLELVPCFSVSPKAAILDFKMAATFGLIQHHTYS